MRALMGAGFQLRIEGLADGERAGAETVAKEKWRARTHAPAVAPTPPETPAGGLTEEQEQAVTRRSESLLLAAAAGSGKTSVLVERFVRAVREDELAPARVLAITFTERAASELRERVRARLLELGEREAARDAEAAFVGTFHGFCARLLRAHALTAGLEPDFAILEEGLAARLRRDAFKAALRVFVQSERPAAVDLLAAYGPDRVQAMITGVHAHLRSRGQRLPRLPAPAPSPAPRLWAGEEDAQAAEACVLLDELLGAFGGAYERLKRDRGAVDFDDLELCALALLEEHESVRAAWSERFALLMVDEFQDTNPRQLAILRALEHGNLFTVGDERQSIYGFRHADVALFRQRRSELQPRGGCLALTRNFRARAPLLGVVNAVFAERMADFAPLLAARREAAAGEPAVELLLTARGDWTETLSERVAGRLPSAAPWRQAEALLLAQRVHELVHEDGVLPGEVVVLLRALGDVEVYERALQLYGLRTLAAAGAFWDQQQVRDLLAYLSALANPLDELALYATLASPLVGVSRDGLALLANAARAAGGQSVWQTALRAGEEPPPGISREDGDALAGFCAYMREERAAASRRTIAELIERALAAGRYREHTLSLPAGERRLANVHKLLRLARRFEATEGRDLRAFLDHAAHLADTAGGESYAPVDGPQADAVRLMSVHAAKGLEFPVVCLADLGRMPNTRMPDLLVDGDRIGLALVRLDGARATPALDFERLCEERRRAEAEEEDRIMYVAMTRARERLVLSGALDFARWPEPSRGATPPIVWLARALAPELPARLAEALTPAAGATGTVLPAAPQLQLAVGPAAAAVRCRLHTPADPVAPPPRGSDVPDVSANAQRAPSSIPIDSAVAPGELPPTLSYSSLSELERCGYRYYLERVLGLPEDRAPGSSSGPGLDARARGTLVHALLEALDFARPSAPSPAQVGTTARRLGMRVGEEERAEVAALIDGAVSSRLLARVAVATRVRREHPFAFVVEAPGGAVAERAPAGGQAVAPLVTGVIDLLAWEADGGLLVLDYKSDKVGPDADLGAYVEREYAVQRLLYALAALRTGAAGVEVVHWFLERPHEEVLVRYAASDRGELQTRLQVRLRAARAHPFAVSSKPHRGLCLTCPGRARLCSWSEEQTLRDEPGI
jgi:ATP-dependent helicase/nuclease subunit A